MKPENINALFLYLNKCFPTVTTTVQEVEAMRPALVMLDGVMRGTLVLDVKQANPPSESK